MRAASYPRVVLAQLCCRLTLATSASAEGVWVMWMGPVNPQPGTRTWEVWSPLHSYEALEPCKADAERNHHRVRKSTTDHFNYVCLPDTVAPLGPKGK